MRLNEKSSEPIFLTSEEVLIKHPMATRAWFIDCRQRLKKALRMNPKQIMELCDWYEKGRILYCRSKKTGRELFWDSPILTWMPTKKSI